MPRGDWIQTYSGRQFFPLSPRPEDIDLEDVAHALAYQTRYTGHAPEAYTIAQHSVLVSARAAELVQKRNGTVDEVRSAALWGLLHDASEAYIVDVPRPIKPMLTNYRELEEKVMQAVAARFALPSTVLPEVKLADNDALVTEAHFFFPEAKRPAPWSVVGEVFASEFFVWSHAEAVEYFLDRADDLGLDVHNV